MSTDNEQELTLTADEIAIAEGREPEITGNDPPKTPPPAEATAQGDDDEPDGEEVITEGEDSTKTRRKVSYGALHKERQERQRIEREFAQHREMTAANMARGEERMRQLAQAMEARQPKAEEPAPPDPDIDPLGRIAYLEELVKKQGQTTEQQIRQTQETTVRNQVVQFAQQDEAHARTQAPDYDAAKAYLLQSRGQELFVASGRRATDAQIRQQLAAEEEQLRITAIQEGERPAIRVYQMAQARGYRPQQTPAVATEANGRLEAVAKAQEANKSLSTASSGASPKSYSFADIAAMPQDEFEALRNKMGPKAFDAKLERLMGAS